MNYSADRGTWYVYIDQIDLSTTPMQPGFHPVTKFGVEWIIEWAYSARQVPWDEF